MYASPLLFVKLLSSVTTIAITTHAPLSKTDPQMHPKKYATQSRKTKNIKNKTTPRNRRTCLPYAKSKVVYDSICSFEHELLQLCGGRTEKKTYRERNGKKKSANTNMCCTQISDEEKLISQRGN